MINLFSALRPLFKIRVNVNPPTEDLDFMPTPPTHILLMMAGCSLYWGVADGPQVYLCAASDDFIIATNDGEEQGIARVAITREVMEHFVNEIDPHIGECVKLLQKRDEMERRNLRRRALSLLGDDCSALSDNQEVILLNEEVNRMLACIAAELRIFAERWDASPV